MKRIRRIAWIAGAGLTALLLSATAHWRGSPPEARAQQAAPGEATAAAGAKGPEAPSAAAATAAAKAMDEELPKLEGDYDVNELRRLIDLARESGFTEEQIKQITVEDANGKVINAVEFIQAYERRRKLELARREALENKVYLSPKDIIRELDQKQPKDLQQLRDKLIFVE